MKAKITEIFQSIQGEGRYVGTRQVFVRFFGCNMHCQWCDSPASNASGKGHFKNFTVQGLLSQVKRLWKSCHSVSLTGGEPLIQGEFIREFLPYLKKAGMKSYLETNGVCYNELADIIKGIDIISMDLKLPSSTRCQLCWDEHEKFLKTAVKKEVFIKAVVTANTEKKDIVKAVQLIKKIAPDVLLILQPNTFDWKKGSLRKCVEFQKYALAHLADVRVIPQVHKLLKLR